MIEINNVETYGWEAAIRGLRNPLNSWDRSDSVFGCDKQLYDDGSHRDCVWCKAFEWCYEDEWEFANPRKDGFAIGSNDHDLMMRLAKAGSEHAKYRRMITVTCDITAPLYWWKECDTYKVGTVCNSCSTMHRIHANEFTLDDFSHEHLGITAGCVLEDVIEFLNVFRESYVSTKDKSDWWQLIQLLPSSYNQRRTLQMNYEVLANMYRQRRNHKLDEWVDFCKWIESLPYSELITLEEC